MVGGELVFVLEEGDTGFSRSQDKRTTIEDSRRRKRVMGLIRDHNPQGSASLNERIEMFLFFMNILRKKIDLFCNHFLVSLMPCPFKIDPDLCSQPICSNAGPFLIIENCIRAKEKSSLINNDHVLLQVQLHHPPLKSYYTFIRGKSQRRNNEDQENKEGESNIEKCSLHVIPPIRRLFSK
jgi:hypothetical protein